jgi:hypothetical protein
MKTKNKSTKKLASGVSYISLFTVRVQAFRTVSSQLQTSVKSAVLQTFARLKMTFPFFSKTYQQAL